MNSAGYLAASSRDASPGRLALTRAALAMMAVVVLSPSPARAFCDVLGLVAEIETAAAETISEAGSADAFSTLEARLDDLHARREELNSEAFRAAISGVSLGDYLDSREDFARRLRADGPSPSTVPSPAPQDDRLMRLMGSDEMAQACPEEASVFAEAAVNSPFTGLIAPPPDAPQGDAPDERPGALGSSASETPTDDASGGTANLNADKPTARASAITGRLAALASKLEEDTNAAVVAALALVGFAAPLAIRATLRVRRRREARYLCYLEASVTSETGSLSTHIVDISKAGARIATKNLIGSGDRVAISLECVSRSAQIVWTKPSFGGALFDEPLSRREMAAVLAAAKKGAGVAPQA